MNREQMLLIKLMEEMAETQQEISKALWFGLNEQYEKHDLTNHGRVIKEIKDVINTLALLEEEGYLEGCVPNEDEYEAKVDKINKYISYSEKLGIYVPIKIGDKKF